MGKRPTFARSLQMFWLSVLEIMIKNHQISAIRFQAGTQLQKNAYILKLPYLFLIAKFG
jgi:hypothetical protein